MKKFALILLILLLLLWNCFENTCIVYSTSYIKKVTWL